MSAVTGTAAPRVARPVTASVRPPQPGRSGLVGAVLADRGTKAFVLLVLGVLVLGLLGLLALNTLLAQRAFVEHDLAQQNRLLALRSQALEQQVAVLESPQQLAVKAVRLGLVPAGNPAFVDPRTGTVLGVPTPAAPRPVATPKPTGTPAVAAAPGAARTPAPTAARTATPTASPVRR